MSEEKNIIVDAKEKLINTIDGAINAAKNSINVTDSAINAAKDSINVTVGTAEKPENAKTEHTSEVITAATAAAKQDWKRTIASVLIGAIIMSLANIGIDKAHVAAQKARYQEIRQASIEAVEALKAGDTKLAQEKINVITTKSNEILDEAKTVVDNVKTRVKQAESYSPKE